MEGEALLPLKRRELRVPPSVLQGGVFFDFSPVFLSPFPSII
jgi:hypothetical protein